MAYKYTGIQPNAEQMGVYVEETVIASGANTIPCSYTIANKMIYEQWIHDPINHDSYTFGIVKLYNNTNTADIYGLIDSVSGKTITTSSGVASTNSITVGYYAVGTAVGTTTQCLAPNRTVANSDYARLETLQSHFNAMDIKSAWNLPQLGYRWADALATKYITGSAISDASFNSEFYFDMDNDTNDNTDWHVDMDNTYPIILEEIRLTADDKQILLEPIIKLGSRTTDDLFGEDSHEYIDMDSSSATYTTNDANVWILSIPLAGMACDEVQIYMKRDGFGTGDHIQVELCGWYKRLTGA